MNACSAEQKNKAQIPEVQKQINQKYQFKVHGCAINYNGTDLYINTPIEEWVKLLGNNYRKLKGFDGTNDVDTYTFDEIGIIVYVRTVDKTIESIDFIFPPKQTMSEAEPESPKKLFKDAISVESLLIGGGYPLDSEIRNNFQAKTSASYSKAARCTTNQKNDQVFFVEVSTTLDEPEIIDAISFRNILPNINHKNSKNDKPAFCTEDNKDFSPQCK